MLERGLAQLAVTGTVGTAVVALDAFHADPADRLIVASARLERASLLTADARILAWPGALHRADARR